MKTELSFLLELLLDHKLPKPTQKAVKDRIDFIQTAPATVLHGPQGAVPVMPATVRTFSVAQPPANYNPRSAGQPESMRKIMEQNPDLLPKSPASALEPIASPANTAPEVQGINVSPVALQAMQDRQRMLNEAIAGPKKGSIAAPKTHMGGNKQ